MKKILTLISIFTLSTLSAQTLVAPFQDVEQPRGVVIPYGRAVDATKADPSASNYVAKLAEWSVSEDKMCYQSSFAVPVWWLNRQVIVRVGSATSAYRVLVDDRVVGAAASGATPIEFNVSKYAKEGRHNLKIELVDAEQNVVNALYGKVAPKVEDVVVMCQPTLRVRDIDCSTTINDNGEGVAEFAVVIKCNSLNAKRARIGYQIHLNDTTLLDRGYREIALDMRREDTLRFMARVPKAGLWSVKSPHLITLDLDNRIDNRPAEYISRKVGVRAADVVEDKLIINGEPVELKLVDYDSSKLLTEQLVNGANGIVLPVYYATEDLLSQCDRAGVLVVVQAGINTLTLSQSIQRGGNPSNDPFWLETYLSYNRNAYYTTRHHPSVVGFALAAGKTTGINVYESYLMLKKIESRLPIIYEGACGQWCSDKITFR